MIIFLIVMSVFTIAFSLAAKFTAFSTLDEYKYLKTIVSLEIEREERNNIAYSDNFRFNKFWYEFESFEDKIIIADMTCCGLLLTFLIIELIIYNTNLNKETKSGPLRGILILLNFLFYLCFYILFTFLIYAIIYSFLVIIMNPSYFSTASTYSQQESEWADKKYIRGFIHHGILWVLMIFTCILTSTDRTLFFLLEMYNEDDDNNVENNMDKIKSKTISLGNQDINIQIKLNKCIYLKEYQAVIKKFEFRQILLENVRKDFLYINMENSGIDNMLSIADWRYPNMDPIVDMLKPLAKLIFISMIIAFIPTLFHIKDQPAYQQIILVFDFFKPPNVKFIPIFKIIGNFENGVTDSRFYIYLVIIVILELFILKRFYFGGFSSYCYANICFILSVILYIINIIYLILSLCIAVFSLLSIMTVIDYKKIDQSTNNNKDISMLTFILLVQMALNFSFFGEMIRPSLSRSKALYSRFGIIKTDLIKLYQTNEQGKTEFQFIGLDSNNHLLTEVIIPNYPRFLFYSLDNNINTNNNENKNINNDVLKLNSEENLINANINAISEQTELKINTKK